MNAAQIIENSLKKIVFIGLEKQIDELGRQKAVNIVGSGFIIRDQKGEKLITAGHVLNQAKTISKIDKTRLFLGVYKGKNNNITEYDLKTIDQSQFVIDSKNDLGVAPLEKIPSKNVFSMSKLKLDSDYKEGTKCISIGFPLVNEFIAIGVGITLFASSCMIASVKYNAKRNDIDFILTDTHVNPSSSGSPLIDESSGNIIGIVAGTFQNNFVGPVMAEKKVATGVQVPRNIGLIRPSYYLKDLIKHGTT